VTHSTSDACCALQLLLCITYASFLRTARSVCTSVLPAAGHYGGKHVAQREPAVASLHQPIFTLFHRFVGVACTWTSAAESSHTHPPSTYGGVN
jgi:hypothetical protein